MPDAPNPPPPPDGGTPATPKPAQPREVQPGLIGDYANFARIAHTPGDFVIDFGQHVAEQQTVAMKRRIIMSPVNVKSLLRALEENVRKYEESFGPIANDPSR